MILKRLGILKWGPDALLVVGIGVAGVGIYRLWTTDLGMILVGLALVATSLLIARTGD